MPRSRAVLSLLVVVALSACADSPATPLDAAPDLAPDLAPRQDLPGASDLAPPGVELRPGDLVPGLDRTPAREASADLPATCPTGSWCSALYPPGWTPSSAADAKGRFLHDFSYAGYHRGELPLPATVGGVIVDAVKDHGGDPTASKDSTSAIQAAIDAVAKAKGGVVLIPAGVYRIDGTLSVTQSSTVIRGAGASQTTLRFSKHAGMSNGAHLRLAGQVTRGPDRLLAQDALARATAVELKDLGTLKVGDAVALGWVISSDFVAEHGMTGIWYSGFIGQWKPIFRRTVVAIDPIMKRVTLDVPLRYPAKIRDQASLRIESGYLTECGVEQLSLANAVAWDQAWAEDQVAVLELTDAADCWVRDVHSTSSPLATGYTASDKTPYHLQSGGIRVQGSKRVTILGCSMRSAQNRGGGGNGYLFEVRSSSELLLRDCIARDGRHNFIQNWDFGLSGSVFTGLDSAGSTMVTIVLGVPVPWPGRCEYHHALAIGNLVEDSTLDDGWEGKNRGTESSGAGHTATTSVFWNLRGKGTLLSKQYGWGYLIGTAGTVTLDTALDPIAGSGTAPEDYVEGAGQGATLFPQSLYQHQLARRLASP
jgi:hypothetical protein